MTELSEQLLFKDLRYRAALHRDADGIWRGQAESNQGVGLIVGDAPRFELTNGTLTLRRTNFERPKWMEKTQSPGRMSTQVSMPVGDAFEAVLRTGDVIRTGKTWTGDVAVSLYRDGQLQMALGAATGHLLDAGISVTPDPRVHDDEFYGVVRTLRQPDTTLVWLDPAAPDLKSQLTRLDRGPLPPTIKIVVVVEPSSERGKRSELTERLREGPPRAWSCRFYTAPAGITTRAEFNAYLDTLPEHRPPDLFLRITIDGKEHELREGEYQARGPWHLLVAEVQRYGYPGRSSRLGVARVDAALSAEAFATSARSVRYCLSLP